MINTNGKYLYCDSILKCPERIRNTWWGRLKANGWFFSCKDDIAFCPTHVPQNIFIWRKIK